MERKKLMAAVGCRGGRAVALKGREDLGEDLLTLCQACADGGADGLLIADLSGTEADHERTVGLIREAARAVDVPVIAGGRVRRLEDVKKYLYAGAAAVFLDVSEEACGERMREAADRFGSEKVCAYLPGPRYLERAEEYARLGASRLIADGCPAGGEARRRSAGPLPVLVLCGGGETDVPDLLRDPSVSGVILPADPRGDLDFMGLKQELKRQGLAVETLESTLRWSDFKTGADGLVPVVVQDFRTLEVLMLAYMNEEAFRRTLESGRMTYFSRERQSLWVKGETSGHYQFVRSLRLDCDGDTILAKVRQIGAACHTGARSCFFRPLAQGEYRDLQPQRVLENVFRVILERRQHPREGSYTSYLFDRGTDKILKKIGEEATEIVIAAKNPQREELVYEMADFLYHMMVLMADRGIGWEDVAGEMANRER